MERKREKKIFLKGREVTVQKPIINKDEILKSDLDIL